MRGLELFAMLGMLVFFILPTASLAALVVLAVLKIWFSFSLLWLLVPTATLAISVIFWAKSIAEPRRGTND